MKLRKLIENYVPRNEQEAADKEFMLGYMERFDDCLTRENKIAHFTASVWVINPQRTKVLMVYHNIYNSWSWTGGHADGEEDLAAVAMRELKEETGVEHARLVSDELFSLEVLTVDGHVKKGSYVSSHLHLNVTFLAEADEEDALRSKEDENSGVRWLTNEEAVTMPTEPWMVQRIYRKLIEKSGLRK